MKRHLKGVFTAAAVTTLATASISALADGNVWEYTISHDASNHICIDFQEVEVLLPESWSGKCQMTTSGSSVSFYHAASRERFTEDYGYENGGLLFSLNVTQDSSYLEEPHYLELGYGNEGFYYLSLPTDVQGYIDDEAVYAEFDEMAADVSWVEDNITFLCETEMVYSEEESLIANSSSEYLTEEMLADYDADYLQMAINEIYARHHRLFILDNVREHFEATSWYDGYIAPDDFDPSVMSELEQANIALMLRVMNEEAVSEDEELPDDFDDVYEEAFDDTFEEEVFTYDGEEEVAVG